VDASGKESPNRSHGGVVFPAACLFFQTISQKPSIHPIHLRSPNLT